MARWSERARQRLRDGEEIEDAISFGENGIVVTNQRLLAFTPESDGANYRAIERPNVEGTALESNGETQWLGYVGKGALAGLVGVGVGYTMDFGGLVSLSQLNTKAASQTGVGSMMGLLSTVSRFLGMLDDALLVAGLLAFAVCLGALGLYLESRTHGLWIAVAGDDDLYVPAPKGATTELTRLQRHLRTEPDPGAETAPREDPLEPHPE